MTQLKDRVFLDISLTAVLCVSVIAFTRYAQISKIGIPNSICILIIAC